MLVDRKPLKIRPANIDAPERWQAFAQICDHEMS
jgi:hypothetical protein